MEVDEPPPYKIFNYCDFCKSNHFPDNDLIYCKDCNRCINEYGKLHCNICNKHTLIPKYKHCEHSGCEEHIKNNNIHCEECNEHHNIKNNHCIYCNRPISGRNYHKKCYNDTWNGYIYNMLPYMPTCTIL